MIYISTACVKHEKISDSIEELARAGFKNIELSGGTKYYEGLENDLLTLKEKYGLNYLLHNYFPPPKTDFILNLASLDEGIYRQSLEHCERSLALSRRLGASKFSFHAGFLIDVKAGEIGKKISRAKLNEKKAALDRFFQGFRHLKGLAGGIELYLENNVISSTNLEEFQGVNPFFMTDAAGYQELKGSIPFKLLLDIAHLFVSSRSLSLDFDDEISQLLPHSDYVHLSHNDGLHDQARAFSPESPILKALSGYDLTGKTITLEIYDSVENIRRSKNLIETMLGLQQARA